MSYRYTYTVFTPTYNRAHTLPEVYNGLKKQTFRDFEWIIVDDGSTDGTDKLVEKWQAEADFPIRYFWQENGGKHRARKRGVAEAQGEFFFTWDSDDECVPQALEQMKAHWDAISEEQKPFFAGVAGLCAHKDGTIVGSRFPHNVLESDMFEIREHYRVTGDKCGFQRTDVMREFPFPEFEGERFITESVVWYRIARKYKTLFFNEILRICDYRPDGLSAAWLRHIVESPRGRVLFFNEYMEMPARLMNLFKAGVNYVRYSLHAGKGLRTLVKEATRPLFVVLGIPMGIILYLKDRKAYKKEYGKASS